LSQRLIIGDTRDVLATLGPASVDLIFTSPPFLALRSYLPADHPDKHKEIGSEATPGEFLDTLLDVVTACERVLAPHGSMVIELGDTFAGSGGAGGDYNPGGWREGQEAFQGSNYRELESTKDCRVTDGSGRPPNLHGKKQPGGPGWPLEKSLCFIPQLFGMSLAYGFNPLTGREIDRWRVRNVIAWCRPNPPVGALADKCRPATSYLTVATKSRSRWFDMDAVRQPAQVQMGRAVPGNNTKGADAASHRFAERVDSNPAGAPLLDWWELPTEPYKGSHYATFPRTVAQRVILLMCPEKVCVKCGEPSRRIVAPTEYTGRGVSDHLGADHRADRPSANSTTLGWTDCDCSDDLPVAPKWRRGVVLDLFVGSGTTMEMAAKLGRDSVGIDLDESNERLVAQRLGLFYEGDELAEENRRRDAYAMENDA
jgi:DNA methylase